MSHQSGAWSFVEHDPEKAYPALVAGRAAFSLAANPERVCAEIMLNQ
jgi:hypothetical protein